MKGVFADPGVQIGFVRFGGFDAPFPPATEFVVVDVETTGFDPDAGDRVLEVAALRTTGDGQVTAAFSSLVNPGVTDTGASEVHGITAHMLIGAPSFAEIWPALAAFLSGAVFVAHNAAFDAAFLAAEATAAGVRPEVQPGLCTLWLARQALPHLPSHRLAAVQEALGLTTSKAHAAHADAAVVVEALPGLLAGVDAVRHHVPMTKLRPAPQGIRSVSR